MEFINNLKANFNVNVNNLEKFITTIQDENNKLKTELSEKNLYIAKLNDEMKNLNSVSRIKNQDKQLFEMQKENDFLKSQLEKYKKDKSNNINETPKVITKETVKETPRETPKEPSNVSTKEIVKETINETPRETPKEEQEEENNLTVIKYKKKDYLLNEDTNEIFEAINNVNILVANLVNGKFKKL